MKNILALLTLFATGCFGALPPPPAFTPGAGYGYGARPSYYGSPYGGSIYIHTSLDPAMHARIYAYMAGQSAAIPVALPPQGGEAADTPDGVTAADHALAGEIVEQSRRTGRLEARVRH